MYKEKRGAIVRITKEYLIQLLEKLTDMKIDDAVFIEEPSRDIIGFKIRSKDAPVVAEGQEYTYISPKELDPSPEDPQGKAKEELIDLFRPVMEEIVDRALHDFWNKPMDEWKLVNTPTPDTPTPNVTPAITWTGVDTASYTYPQLGEEWFDQYGIKRSDPNV